MIICIRLMSLELGMLLMLVYRKKVAKVVHTSTIGVYTGNDNVFNVTEDSKYSAEENFMAYVYTKLLGEYEIKLGIKKGLWATIVNPASIIGKYDITGFARVAFMLQNRELPGVGSSLLMHNRVNEIAQGHITAASLGRLGENYILAGPSNTFKDLVDEFGKHIGVDTSSIIIIPYSLMKVLAEVEGYYGDIVGKEQPLSPEVLQVADIKISGTSAKAVKEFGYKDNIPLSVSIKESIDWLIKTKRFVIKK